ncbi:MAG TPA: LptA/OstA family protein [Candidatus Elarobacter sp.]|jgi:lipopolysaccharide export system protein LptA|nr:LptA/OstA family protein [Candidatus Elarobacter sp.]
MRSVAFASFAGLTLAIVCAGAGPSPSPVATPSRASASPGTAPPHASTPSTTPPSGAPHFPSPPPRASSSPEPGLPALETAEYRIETDQITYKGNGDFTMPHHVSLSRPGSDATADRAEGNQRRGTIRLFGHVVVHDDGHAAEASDNDQYAKGGPSTLTCDELDVDSKAKVYIATGHMHYEQGTRKAEAERGVLNRGSGMLHLEGDVKTTDGASTLAAHQLDYNLNTKKVLADGKPIVIKQPVPSPEPGSVSPTPKPKRYRLPIPLPI